MKNEKSKKSKSIMCALVIAGTAFVVLTIATTPVSHAANFTYYNWKGYEGNDTIYMATATMLEGNNVPVPGFNPDLYLDPCSVAEQNVLYYQNWAGSSENGNAVSIATSDDIPLADHTGFAFNQEYVSGDNLILVSLPIVVNGLEYTPQGYADHVEPLQVDSLQVSTGVYGLPSNNPVDISIVQGWDSGVNVTGIDPEDNLPANYEANLETGLDSASMTLGIAALLAPPPMDVAMVATATAITLLGIATRYAGVAPHSNYGTVTYPDASAQVDEIRAPSYGHWDSNYNDPIYYSNSYSSNELVTFQVPVSDFNSLLPGVVSITATNTVGPYAWEGATASLVFSIVPSSLLYGLVTDNNNPMANQKILITQTASSGQITDFYEKTNSLGYYEFYAQPTSSYEVQVLTPSGLSSGSFTPGAIPLSYGQSTELPLSLDIPASITFTEGGSGFPGSGLPAGTPWQLTFENQVYQVTSSSITFTCLPYGQQYTYSIASIPSYTIYPQSGGGSITSLGITQHVLISKEANLTINVTGLPDGSIFDITIVDQNVGIDLNEQYFVGTPLPTQWPGLSSNSSIALPYDNGYTYEINQVIPPYGQGEYVPILYGHRVVGVGFIVYPNLTNLSIQFAPSVNTVFFIEHGLPQGQSWTMSFNGNEPNQVSGNETSYSMNSDNSYAYSASTVNINGLTYYPFPRTGWVYLPFHNVTENVTYIAGPVLVSPDASVWVSGTYDVPADEITPGESIMTFNSTTYKVTPANVEAVVYVNISIPNLFGGDYPYTSASSIGAWENTLYFYSADYIFASNGYIAGPSIRLGSYYSPLLGVNFTVGSVGSQEGGYEFIDILTDTPNSNYIANGLVISAGPDTSLNFGENMSPPWPYLFP